MPIIIKFSRSRGNMPSVFDFLTFGVLLLMLHASTDLFRSAWFIESSLSEVIVVLVIRSRRFFFNSKPGRYLFWTTVATCAGTILIPYTPLGQAFELVPLVPLIYPLLMLLFVVLYIVSAELTKRVFYRTKA